MIQVFFCKKQASFESRSSPPATILRGSQYEQENHRTYGSTLHSLQFPGQLIMIPHNIKKTWELNTACHILIDPSQSFLFPTSPKLRKSRRGSISVMYVRKKMENLSRAAKDVWPRDGASQSLPKKTKHVRVWHAVNMFYLYNKKSIKHDNFILL